MKTDASAVSTRDVAREGTPGHWSRMFSKNEESYVREREESYKEKNRIYQYININTL